MCVILGTKCTCVLTDLSNCLLIPLMTSWHGKTLHHDDVITWKDFPRYWSFVWEIHRSRVNSHHKGQWRGALVFSLICAGMNDWVNNREAGDLRRHRAHFDVIVMITVLSDGESTSPGSARRKPVMQNFDANLKKLLNELSSCQLIETPCIGATLTYPSHI